MMRYIEYRHIATVVAVILSLTLTACSDDAPGGDDGERLAVQFATTIGDGNWNTLSRVNTEDGISITSFSNGDQIVMDAWYLPEGTTQRSATPDFMNNQTMTYNESADSWDYTPVKYWPNNQGDKLEFFAYHLGKATDYTITDNAQDTGYPTITFDHRANNGGNYPYDILATKVTTLSREDATGGKAPLEFHHIMARIKMKMRYIHSDGTTDADETIHIQAIQLWGYPIYGIFSGFDESGAPIWSDVTVFNEKNESRGLVDYNTNDKKERLGYVITAGEEYTEIPGFTHFAYPWRTYDETTDTWNTELAFDITNITGDTYGGALNGEPVRVDIDFKAGYTTTILVTIGATGISIDTTAEAMPDWSNTDDTKHDANVNF